MNTNKRTHQKWNGVKQNYRNFVCILCLFLARFRSFRYMRGDSRGTSY